jgi:hypothetical protein
VADFVSAVFSDTARFAFTNFKQRVSFASVNFQGDAVFRNTKFVSAADFPVAKFDGNADFTEASFHSEALPTLAAIRFEGATFRKFTSFRDCHFVFEYPEFIGATLYEKTAFTPQDKFWPPFRQGNCQQGKDSCGIIRHAVAKQGLPEDEHFFFRREMELSRLSAMTKADGGWPYSKAWPYWIFKTFSNYGESIERPINALCGLFGFGFGAFLAHFSGLNETWGALRDAAAISLSNLLPVFGFGRIFLADELKTLTAGLQFLAGTQTVLALPLLFFLGLGVRTRFRMR